MQPAHEHTSGFPVLRSASWAGKGMFEEQDEMRARELDDRRDATVRITGGVLEMVAKGRNVGSGRLLLFPLLILLPVLTGYSAIESIFGVNSGATVQKLAVLVAIVLAGIFLGFRVPHWAAVAVIAIFGIALVFASLTQDDAPVSILLRGTGGYVYAWLAFIVDWSAIPSRLRAVTLATAPAVAIAISVPLVFTGNASFVMHEYTGAVRFAAGMPPAYLASLALFGAIGAAWLWSLGSPWGLWLAAFNALVCVMTVTRGATIATGIVVLTMLVVGAIRRQPQWQFGVVGGALGVVAACILFVPTFIERFLSSAQGVFGFSGRTEAWSYFLSRVADHPWVGHGAGGATLLAAESGNATIEKSFISPHSAYVSLLVDIGIPLTVAFFALLFTLFVCVARRGEPGFAPVAFGAMVACAFYGMFDNLLNAPQSAVPLALFLALAMASRAGVADDLSKP